MSNPWMKFFPADWRSDPALRLCSRAARGTWIDMLSIMHEATPYGELRVNGIALDAKGLAKLLGEMVEDIIQDLEELERCGVFSRKKNGVIYSRRMEKDENLRRKKIENGKKGGNPSLRKQTENEALDNQDDKPQKPEARSQKPESIVSHPSDAQPQSSKARGQTLPDDWSPSDRHYAAADAMRRDPGWVDRQAEAMREWALANRNRAVARKADWDLTFLGWMRRESEKNPNQSNTGGQNAGRSNFNSRPASASGPSQRISAMAEILAERHEQRIQGDNLGGFGSDRRAEAGHQTDADAFRGSLSARVG